LKEECGSAATHLCADGRHFQEIDVQSWHVLLQNEDGTILGCARYRTLEGDFNDLAANHSALAHSLRYGPQFRSTMYQLMMNARKHNKQCGEAGGWVLRREVRGTTAGLNIALMTFALAEHLNCGLGITTATRMHHSAAMLCRIGAHRVANLPAYYEPMYGSIIELLQFDLPQQNPIYAARLDKFRKMILSTPVIAGMDVMPYSQRVGLLRLASALDPRIADLGEKPTPHHQLALLENRAESFRLSDKFSEILA
jgi:hypothetical protein